MPEPLSWTDYVKTIAKQEGLSYHQALSVAGKSWPDYKAKYGTVSKPEPSKSQDAPSGEPSGLSQEKTPTKKAPGKRAPRKPRQTKAKKLAEENEKLRMKAELMEAKEKLREKEKEEKPKKKPAKKAKKKRKMDSDSECESDSE